MSLKNESIKLIRKTRGFLFQRKFKDIKNNNIKLNHPDTKKLILFFVPDGAYRLTGGILSICTIHSVVKELKHIHNCDVIASFLPNKKEKDYKYRKFKNDMIIYSFNEIETHFKTLDFLEIQIPDVMITSFKKENKEMSKFFKWTEGLDNIKINILNQNDLLMPALENVQDLRKIFPNMTMTVAHEQYATIEKRNYYNMPLHLLSPWLSPTPYLKRSYSEKENLILYSPDEIQSVPNGSSITKKEIIASLKMNLKHYKFIEIKNMKYDTYKDYASRSKFAITFGEGLDGYFTETVFSGGISFAVYNKIFFTHEYENLQSLYSSFDELMCKITDDIKYFDEISNYENYHHIQDNIISKKYSHDKLKSDVENFYLNQYDFN
jgi:hypothetical protein